MTSRLVKLRNYLQPQTRLLYLLPLADNHAPTVLAKPHGRHTQFHLNLTSMKLYHPLKKGPLQRLIPDIPLDLDTQTIYPNQATQKLPSKLVIGVFLAAGTKYDDAMW